MYGLLAEEMLVAPDKSSITFRLHPEGALLQRRPGAPPPTSSTRFDMLTSKGAAPAYAAALDGVERARCVDERTIRFDLKERTDDTIFNVGGMPVFSRKWGAGPTASRSRSTRSSPSTRSPAGPYTIASDRLGPRHRVQAQPRLLGARPRRAARPRSTSTASSTALPGPRGRHGGVQGRRVRPHQGVSARAVGAPARGRQVATTAASSRRCSSTAIGQGLQAYLLNLRRPIFQDRPRARGARLHLRLRDDQPSTSLCKRANSLFTNSDFAAKGLPSPGELQLLEPFRERAAAGGVRPAVRSRRAPTPTRTRCATTCRRRATLLEQAGWKLDADGVLRNAKGEPFEFEYLETQGELAVPQRRLAAQPRQARHQAARRARSTSRCTASAWRRSTSTSSRSRTPTSRCRRRATTSTMLGSKAADEPGSDNYRGVKSPAVDALLEAMDERQDLRRAARRRARARPHRDAWNYYQVPRPVLAGEHACRTGTSSASRRCSRSTTRPTSPLDWPAWPVGTWWIKDPAATQAQPMTGRTRMLSYIAQAPAADDPDAARASLTVTFIVIQFVPGGPVEQLMAEARARRRRRRRAATAARRRDIDAKQIEELKKLYGFDKPPHDALLSRCSSSFARFDLGTQLPAQQGRVAADQGEAAGVDQPRAVDLPLTLPDLDPARASPRRCARARASTRRPRCWCWSATRFPASCSACC